MDGIEPDLVDRARTMLCQTPDVLAVPKLQLRWVGHRLQGAATIRVGDMPLSSAQRIAHVAEHEVARTLPARTG